MNLSLVTSGVISVLMADSNQTQSQLLCCTLRRQGTFKVANARAELSACLSALERDPADVLLLADGITADRNGLYELLRAVRSAYPKIAIILLLDGYDRDLVVNSLRAGARGLFCLASMPFKSLCRCIASVHQGQYWTNTEQMRYVIDALSMGPSMRLVNSRQQVLLTPREEQTVGLVTEGLNNRDIAKELNLKENTVKKSLLRIYDKVGVSNRVELVLYALSHSQSCAPESVQEEAAHLGRQPRQQMGGTALMLCV